MSWPASTSSVVRRVGFFLLTDFVAVGLANVFGQGTGETSVESDAARLTLRAPDGHLVARLQYQVNTTAVGPRTQHVVLEDDGVPLLRLEHTAFVYP